MAGNPPTLGAAPAAAATLSRTMRAYLAHIYRLGGADMAGTFVGTSALADALMVSPPAVNRMIARLRAAALLDHERYQGIRLTEAGARAALRQLRRQRIAEAFLMAVMGLGWEAISEEAARWASTMTPELETRLWEQAGRPTHCPHGAPIPDADGHLPPDDTLPLAGAPAERNYIIARVTTREADRLAYIAALGLVPGTAVRLLHAAPFSGPLQLRVGSEYRIVGHNLAQWLYVRPV